MLQYIYALRYLIALGLFQSVVFSLGIYKRYDWFDWPMHFLGGAVVATTTVYLYDVLRNKKRVNNISMLLGVFLILSVVSFASVLWELFEFFADMYFPVSLQPTLFDTMMDFFFALEGGFFVAVFMMYRRSL